ncbi:MAG: ABC transporter ATP-binding protein [Crocinitomicaceae bacterium]
MEERINSLVVKDLEIHYQKNQILHEVNLELEKGKIHLLVGPNGSGKTTLLNALSGTVDFSGTIHLEGKPQKQLSRKELAQTVSMVHSVNAVHHILVREFIEMSRFPYTHFLGKLNSEDQKIINQSVELVGISELLNRSLQNLSDGERKKVMITAALIQDCPIMLMDEPTTFLDIGNKYQFSKLIRKIKIELGKTVLISSHDLDLVFQIADSILLIQDKQIQQYSLQEVKAQKLIEKVFGSYDVKLDENGRLQL